MSHKIINVDLTSSVTFSQIKTQKILCIKCAHSFDRTDISSHQSECDGQQKLEHQFICYCPQLQDNQFMSISQIDRFDFPLSKPSVQLKGIGYSCGNQIKLPIIKNKQKVENNNCSFCQKQIVSGEKFSVLPCGHHLHYKCIKKWLIIVQPCKVCDRYELSDTCWTDYSTKSLQDSI